MAASVEEVHGCPLAIWPQLKMQHVAEQSAAANISRGSGSGSGSATGSSSNAAAASGGLAPGGSLAIAPHIHLENPTLIGSDVDKAAAAFAKPIPAQIQRIQANSRVNIFTGKPN
jgi:hypothetical protein